MTEMMQKKTVLSSIVCAQIDEWIKRYPPERKASGVLQALRYVQEENGGSLTPALMDAVADYLEMPKTAVYEVATFYTLFHLQPVGRHVLSVCTSISCWLRGSDDILTHLKKRLGVESGQTTVDGKWTLYEVECLGACTGAPMLQLDNVYHEELTAEKIDKILDLELRK